MHQSSSHICHSKCLQSLIFYYLWKQSGDTASSYSKKIEQNKQEKDWLAWSPLDLDLRQSFLFWTCVRSTKTTDVIKCECKSTFWERCLQVIIVCAVIRVSFWEWFLSSAACEQSRLLLDVWPPGASLHLTDTRTARNFALHEGSKELKNKPAEHAKLPGKDKTVLVTVETAG